MSTAAQNTFKVVQLNAENLFLFLDQPGPRDWRGLSEKEWQKLSSASVPNKSLSKTLWLADSLVDINPDIICLNEVGGLESITNFAKYFLDDRYTPYLIEGNSDRGIDIGFLVRKSLGLEAELRTHKDRPLNFLYPHEIESNTYHATHNPEKVVKTHFFSRDCAELRLRRPGASAPALVMLLVHLKSKLDPDSIDSEGRMRRKAELRALVNIYKEIRAEATPPIPVIVAGDFNGSARREYMSEEFLDLATTDLVNVQEYANRSGEEAATQIIFSRSGGVQALEIDFIFVSPELTQQLQPELISVYRYKSDLRVPLPLPKTIDQRTYLPSDHYPVVATFKRPLIP
jgi:endonuclease/exonuclease/phosphatase family metal-dependent hydrolase